MSLSINAALVSACYDVSPHAEQINLRNLRRLRNAFLLTAQCLRGEARKVTRVSAQVPPYISNHERKYFALVHTPRRTQLNEHISDAVSVIRCRHTELLAVRRHSTTFNTITDGVFSHVPHP